MRRKKNYFYTMFRFTVFLYFVNMLFLVYRQPSIKAVNADSTFTMFNIHIYWLSILRTLKYANPSMQFLTVPK